MFIQVNKNYLHVFLNSIWPLKIINLFHAEAIIVFSDTTMIQCFNRLTFKRPYCPILNNLIAYTMERNVLHVYLYM